MIRKLLFAVSLLFVFTLSAQNRFAVVDIQSVLDSMPEYNLVKLQLRDASARYQEEYRRITEDIDKKFEDYQTMNKDNTPESIKQRRIQEIQNLQKRAEQFLATAEQDLHRQESQLVDPIKVRVKDIIRIVGEKQGYTFVFPADAPLFQSVEVDDITDIVLQRALQQ